MTRIAPLVAVFFTSSLLTRTPAHCSILCAWTKASATVTHTSFLRGDPLQQTSTPLRLYHSSWSTERALLACAWSDDAAVIQNYLSVCHANTHDFSDAQTNGIDVNSLFETEGDPCVSVDHLGLGVRPERAWTRPARSVGDQTSARSTLQDPEGRAERSEVRSHQRVKRGFIVPGTLWCGSGNKAPSFSDLGVFSETDSCCREHDQCQDTILSFNSKFGVFNSNIFTMSHCECDNKFHSCLMEAGDSISSVVGYTFFNLLKMHCFTFAHRLQCVQRNWVGMCKESKMALYAEVHPPTQYESEPPAGGALNSTMNSTMTSTMNTTSLYPERPPINAAASTEASTTSAGDLGSPEESTRPDPESERKPLESDVDVTELQPPCSVYKDLDQCTDKILPNQMRHGLHNPDATTLYHCNCTARLFQTLAKQRRRSKVQQLLLGRVSPSCFLLPSCSAGRTCTAALVQPALPALEQTSGGGEDVEERRHLVAVQLNYRRRNKRRDRGIRLHRLCLRMSRTRTRTRTRTGPRTGPRTRTRTGPRTGPKPSRKSAVRPGPRV